MPHRTSLSDLLQVFFGDATSDEAVTLNRREAISSLIVDARFMLATPAALRLYGRTAEEMRSWQSLMQPLEEFQRSRTIATARHFDSAVPSRYITQLLTPQGVVPVIKDTREVIIDGESHWLTRLTPATQEPNLPDTAAIVIPEGRADFATFAGRYSIAEVHLLLGQDQVTPQMNLRENLDPSILDDIGLSRKEDTVSSRTADGYDLVFGQPLARMPSGQYMFECQNCGWIWMPRKRAGKSWSEVESDDILVPTRCGNPDRRCYNWQDGVPGTPGPRPTRDRAALRNRTINPLKQ